VWLANPTSQPEMSAVQPQPPEASASAASTWASLAIQWDLSLRAEQPVEGCELSPHPYLKIHNTLDNPTKAKARLLISQSLTRIRSSKLILTSSPSSGRVARGCKDVKMCPVLERIPLTHWTGLASLEVAHP
jgi:hypothetical protein